MNDVYVMFVNNDERVTVQEIIDALEHLGKEREITVKDMSEYSGPVGNLAKLVVF